MSILIGQETYCPRRLLRLLRQLRVLRKIDTKPSPALGFLRQEQHSLSRGQQLRHFAKAIRCEVTPAGKELSVITDTAKKHSDGKPVQQILWKELVAKPLERLAEKLQAEMPEVVARGLTK